MWCASAAKQLFFLPHLSRSIHGSLRHWKTQPLDRSALVFKNAVRRSLLTFSTFLSFSAQNIKCECVAPVSLRSFSAFVTYDDEDETQAWTWPAT